MHQWEIIIIYMTKYKQLFGDLFEQHDKEYIDNLRKGGGK